MMNANIEELMVCKGSRFFLPLGIRIAGVGARIFLLGLLLTTASRSLAKESNWSLDLGVGAGRIQDRSYTEIQVGLNYRLADWLVWRNAGFYRDTSGLDSVYGLDTSARLRLDLELGEDSVLRMYAGPGARFPSEGRVAPLAEGGVALRVSGFMLGVGVKSIFNSVVDKDLEDDTQVTLVLAGGMQL